MDWLIDIFTNTESVAHIVLLYSTVIAIGVLLGKIKFGGISLGVTFVLFAGIVAGHIGFTGPMPILTFLQEFGLVLFVFMIGLQVGPGFFESFGTDGIKMNGLSTALIFLNILVMFGCYYAFFDTSDTQNLPMLVGTLYGAVTNTPGLGAANEALSSVFSDNIPQIASGYACAYPLGVLGIIGATIAIRYLCGINLDKEEERLKAEDAANSANNPHRLRLKVTNSYLEGKTMLQVHNFLNRDFVCSRILHDGHVSIPNRDTIFHIGDILNIVCAENDQEAIVAFIGPETDIDWEEQDQPMVSKRIIVTNPSINGKTLGKMHFSSVHGVNVTRVTRHGIELFASVSLPLQVGDRIMVVGPEDSVNRVTSLMGNSTRRLNAPNIATIFIGIILARSDEAWHRRWPPDHRYSDRTLWLQDTSCDLYDDICQHDASRNRARAVPGKRGYQGRSRILGDSCTGRWSPLRVVWFPDHRYTYYNNWPDSTETFQLQLLHHHGYACGYVY